MMLILPSSFTYATLKCHDIIELHVKHQFHAHLHVSSVITYHLAATFVKPEETDGVKSLEAKTKALGLKVDSYESKIKLMVGNIKKGRQKHDHEDS
jgi:hypothetical protein